MRNKFSCSCMALPSLARMARVLLIVLSLALCSGLAQDACTTFSVSSNCFQPPGDGECISLQEVLNQLAGWEETFRPAECVEVELGVGLHVISQAVVIEGLNISLSIRGEQNASSIECAPSVTLDLNHAIFLDGLETFSFQGVAVYGCVRPIRISNSRKVSFSRSSFRFFGTSGALDVFNCIDVSFVDVTVADNQALSVITDTPFRANAGGISIGVFNLPFTNSSPIISILNCTFLRNRAQPPEADVVSTSQLFLQSVFAGRGGGLGIFVRESAKVTSVVRDCIFEGNFATTFGGGMYVIMDGAVNNHSVYVSGSRFINNEVDGGGGGLHTGYFTPTTALHSVVVTNCTFVGNSALLGGGTYVFPGVGVGRVYSVTYRNCVFQRNMAKEYGAAVGLFSLDLYESVENVNAYIVEDCVFEGNFGNRAGTVSVSYSPLLMLGHNDFINNTGPALRILGTTVTVKSKLEFIGNNAESSDGGALYATSYAQVVLQRGAEMNFIGNRGSLGSAIVVEAQRVADSGFAQLAFNPLCFLRYGPDQTLSPEDWEQVSLSFSGNTAIIGPAVYMNELNLCSWYQLAPPYFDRARVLRWPFINLTNDNLNSGHLQELSSDPSLYIQSPAVSLILDTPHIVGYPGESLKIQVRTLDELQNPTSSIIRLNDLMISSPPSSSTNDGFEPKTFSFDPSLLAFEPRSDLVDISFAVSTDAFVVTDYNVTLSIYDSSTPEAESIIQNALFSAQHCLPGYTLKEEPFRQMKTCQCNTVNNPFLLECESSRLILSPHIWSTVDTNPDGTLSLQSYSCPLDYCQPIHMTNFGRKTYASVFNQRDPDLQCICNRSGILCGKCPNGFGVSALLNHCVSCTNAYSVLVVILVLVDVLLCIAIIAISKPLSGWMYPCLFYVQILPFITDDFPITFQKVQSILYYFSSALALYFPYDFCLYEAMSSLVSYSFRYLPFLTAAVTVTVVVSFRRLKFRPFPWHGVWMIVLLMYTHVVHTSISILNCPAVSPYGHRWYIDGSIECFGGAHAALGVVAALVLLTTTLLVPLTIAVSFNTIQNPRWRRSIVLPLVFAYKDTFHWCVGIELGRRIVVILFAVAFPRVPIVTAFILIITTTFYLFVQPYKSKVANILEALLSLDTIILFFLASNTAVSEALTLEGSTQLKGVTFQENSCPNPVSGVTELTELLAIFYYLPLLVLFIGLAVSTVSFIRRRWRRHMDVHGDTPRYVAFEMEVAEPSKAATFQHTSVRL